MFSKNFYYLTLTSEIADDLFPNIFGDCYSNDASFIATLRALVAPRMSKDDTICLRVRTISPRESYLRDYGETDKIAYLSDYCIDNNTILVCGFNGASEKNRSAALETIDDSFTRVYPKFSELKDLSAFVAKQANMRFYINEEDRSVVVFVDNLNLRLYHYVQSLISRLLPWYFKDKPLEDQERKLVKSLIQRTATGYERLIEEFANKYDFRRKKIEKLLGGFETAAKRQHLRIVDNELNNIENSIDRNVNQYRDYIRQREAKMIEKAGLMAQINSGCKESEILDYFMCNKHLDPVRVNATQLEFIVKCYLENFDVEMYERISSNFDGYMYYDYDVTNDVFADVKVRKKFMDAIFSDEPILKIKTCAHYLIDLTGYVEAPSGYQYPVEYNDMLPNTHIHRHSCLGNQRPLIEEALRNGDNIGAIEQCVCSAKSINVGESATFPYMLKALFSSGAKKIIELPDGTSCSPTEALRWLEAQETNTEVSE